MFQKPALSQEDAKTILRAAEAEAVSNAWPVSIAVCDDGGHLLALLRLDKAPAASAKIAIGKAETAALLRRETKLIEEMINKGRTAFTTVAGIDSMLEGGVPIVVEGHVVGSVGVSGVQSHNDAAIARAGIAALGLSA